MDDMSEELREAIATAPVSLRLLESIELAPPGTGQVLRLVRDQSALSAKLEDTAPRDAGQWVTFDPLAWKAELPAKNDLGRQELRLQLDNVSLQLLDVIMSVDQAAGPWDVVYRLYVSSDLSQPGRRHCMELAGIQITDTQVTGTCLYADHLNASFPRLSYTTDLWPGLGRQ
jgi:hypothetical protein